MTARRRSEGSSTTSSPSGASTFGGTSSDGTENDDQTVPARCGATETPLTSDAPSLTGSPANSAPTTGQSLTPRVLEHLNFQVLTPTLRTVGQLIAEDCTHREIAVILGESETWVAARVQELREAVLEQLRERAQHIEMEVREHLESVRGSTASAATASTRKRRTGNRVGTSRTSAPPATEH